VTPGRPSQAVAASDAARAHGQARTHELLEDLGKSGLGQTQRTGDAGHGHRLVPRQGHLQRGVQRVARGLATTPSSSAASEIATPVSAKA